MSFSSVQCPLPRPIPQISNSDRVKSVLYMALNQLSWTRVARPAGGSEFWGMLARFAYRIMKQCAAPPCGRIVSKKHETRSINKPDWRRLLNSKFLCFKHSSSFRLNYRWNVTLGCYPHLGLAPTPLGHKIIWRAYIFMTPSSRTSDDNAPSPSESITKAWDLYVSSLMRVRDATSQTVAGPVRANFHNKHTKDEFGDWRL